MVRFQNGTTPSILQSGRKAELRWAFTAVFCSFHPFTTSAQKRTAQHLIEHGMHQGIRAEGAEAEEKRLLR